VTTGVVKAVVIGAASVVAVAAGPARPAATRAAGVLLVAAATNLWNGLDVRPGRAVKFGLLATPLVAALDWRLAPIAPGVLLAALLVLPWDVGERAVLGDAGANLLGLAIGLAAYHALSDGQVLLAAGVATGLNVLADTITLSRVIDAVPPLRWLDGLWRRA
jgi:hypothetical protein